jgi:hypothetical protein
MFIFIQGDNILYAWANRCVRDPFMVKYQDEDNINVFRLLWVGLENLQIPTKLYWNNNEWILVHLFVSDRMISKLIAPI